ncbi:zinc finger protein with KRAB and SCAN domains 7-like [Melanotaenia boesemani]|uniref:zinc finger protein with KRAB and SCAN domains 7-like n=1 Tax=Melanotaenia boesemani TaxID=1250792 RepID=UPI001C043B61|nr:zinc finger protein with KRAB and SCAN domains 7-like [Melanotaenia boesemani]
MTAGTSSLYIRLKPTGKLQARQEEPLQKSEEEEQQQQEEEEEQEEEVQQEEEEEHDDYDEESPSTHTRKHHETSTSLLMDIRIGILKDVSLTPCGKLVRKYLFYHLRCPRFLREADFLNLLRSTYSQLADQPFIVLVCDGSQVRPLAAGSVTPEEIDRFSSSTGCPVIYIQRKSQVNLNATEKSGAAAEDPPSIPDPLTLNTSIQSDERASVELRIRVLEDPSTEVLSPSVFQKYPLLKLQCPGGLTPEAFLDLLRSTFPQLAGETFDFLTCNGRKIRLIKVESLTPEEIDKAIKSAGKTVIYIRPKGQEEVQASAKRHRSSLSQTEVSMNSSWNHFEGEVKGGKTLSIRLSPLRLPILSIKIETSDGEDCRKHNGSGEPEKITEQQPANVEVKSQSSKSGLTNGKALLSCKVCQLLRGSLNMLTKHAWSHVDGLNKLCGVCGKQSESAEELRKHLHTHQKTHSCNICGKSFLTVLGFRGHMEMHTGNKPHKCKICHKAFVVKSVLKNHQLVHLANKPHRCRICQWSFISLSKLKIHQLRHADGKHAHIQETFQRVVKLHSSHPAGVERLHSCDMCGRKFPTKNGLWNHLRKHKKTLTCTTCNKMFKFKSALISHMKTHTDKKHFKQRPAWKKHQEVHQLD